MSSNWNSDMMFCDKCGNRSHGFTYHQSCNLRYNEHLHYSCGKCGYDWTGPTLDASDTKKTGFSLSH